MQKVELEKFSVDDLLTLVEYGVMDGFSLAGIGEPSFQMVVHYIVGGVVRD